MLAGRAAIPAVLPELAELAESPELAELPSWGSWPSCRADFYRQGRVWPAGITAGMGRLPGLPASW